MKPTLLRWVIDWVLAGFVVFLVWLAAGCAARVPGTAGRAGKPIENALAMNASLADANKALADAVLSSAKSQLIPQTTVTNITSVQFTVADADKQITAVLQAVADCQAKGGKQCYANASQMNTLVERIRANVNSLVASGDLGIKDAKTQQSVENSAATIARLASSILSDLQAAGVLQ